MLTPISRSEMLKELRLEGKEFAEIGVFKAGFSQDIFSNNPKTLCLVDPWRHQAPSVYPADDFANVSDPEFEAVYAGVCKIFEGKPNVRIIRDFSISAVRSFPDESLDFVYVDAVHTYESCLIDISLWWHKVRPGGWMLGHDYTPGPTSQAIQFPGIRNAVDSFCRVSGRKLGLMTLEPWGSWGIRK